jgi:hypothetical protein
MGYGDIDRGPTVPLRLLSWIPTATQQLDTFAKGSTTSSDSQPPESHKLELFILTDQLTQALSLIQGISLCHTASKDSLGRKYALEVRDTYPPATAMLILFYPGPRRLAYGFPAPAHRS